MSDLYTRVSHPQAFYDRTADLLLTQPEPQYLYAQLWKAAMQTSLMTPAEFGLPGRGIGGVGGNYANESRDRLMLSNPLMNLLIAAKMDFNAESGNTIRINRPLFTDSTYTELSRRLTQGVTVSTTPIPIASQQTSLTLHEYGGPYGSAAVQPYGIAAFDANMGIHDAVDMHGTHLKRDFDKWLDAVVNALLNLGSATTYPNGMTADDDATTANQFRFNLAQIRKVKRQMDTSNLPSFPDGFRAMVLQPQQFEDLGLDPTYQRSAKEFEQYNILFPQYVKSVSKFHLFESNTLTTAANSAATPQNIHTGHALAPGVLLGGMGRPPRIMPHTSDDYGRQALVVWLADCAFANANNTFVRLVKSSGDTA